MLELMVLQEQEQRLQHGDGEHAVGGDRQQDMRQDAGRLIDRLGGAAGHKLGEQNGDKAQGEQQQQQVFHRYTGAGQQRQQNNRSGNQAGGLEEVQRQTTGIEHLQKQAAAMQQQRQCAECNQQAFVGRAALLQAQALVECGSGIKAGSGEAE